MSDFEDKLSEEALANLNLWLHDPEFGTFLPEIERLIREGRWEELEDSFYTHLRIGTGGIRGPLGVGPNRINLRTIGEAAQGLCHFIENYDPQAVPQVREAGVVVGHEARKGSRDFAVLSCEVLAGNGIRSFLFDKSSTSPNGLRATPEVSFAVRYLKATAGVQITASHNPRTDNGFKFYWRDGGQVVPPLDQEFMRLVSGVRQIHTMPILEAMDKGLVSLIGDDVDDAYLKAVRGLSMNKMRSARVVFSPIHGAGSTNVLPVLEAEGFAVSAVDRQIKPDEDFPTAVGDLINPEYREVMEMPISQGEETGADIAICSDPDADRVGVAAKIGPASARMQLLTGNQVGAALTHYILTHRRDRGILSQGDLVMETLVTTGLISDISRSFGLTPRDDLMVGFKFIAEIIEGMEDPSAFVFAAEESLGYLAGDFVRDKDAAIASLLICEMASWLRAQGKTIPMYLDELYEEYGYYKNVQYLVELPGKVGMDIMGRVMSHLRQRPPERVADLPVTRAIDRLDKSLNPGATGDVVSFFLSEDSRTRITVRPSGTEPKLKYYVQHYSFPDGDLSRVKESVDFVAYSLGTGILDYSSLGLSGKLKQEWDHSGRRVV